MVNCLRRELIWETVTPYRCSADRTTTLFLIVSHTTQVKYWKLSDANVNIAQNMRWTKTTLLFSFAGDSKPSLSVIVAKRSQFPLQQKFCLATSKQLMWRDRCRWGRVYILDQGAAESHNHRSSDTVDWLPKNKQLSESHWRSQGEKEEREFTESSNDKIGKTSLRGNN